MTNKVASDFYITLKLENVEGEPVRAKDVSDLKVKVFTSDINTFVEFSNITISDKEDRLYIDYDQLSDLKSGVICYTYSYKIDDTNFKDKYFNSTNINYTNFYLRQTTQVGKDADLSQNEILAICDRKLLDQYKELKTLIETSTPKITIDKELNNTSENPVANKVIDKIINMLRMDILNVEAKIPITQGEDINEIQRSIDEINYKINQKIDTINKILEELKNTTPKITVDTELNINSDNPVANRVVYRQLLDYNSKLRNIETILDLYQKSYLAEYLKDKTVVDLTELKLPLTKLFIPSSIKIVSQPMVSIYNDYKIECIDIEDGCEQLEYSFKNLRNLTKVSLPSTIKKIEGNIFWGCEKLETINFNGTRAQWEKLIEGIKFDNVSYNVEVWVSGEFNYLKLPR